MRKAPRHRCPACGNERVLDEESGLCARCSRSKHLAQRICVACGEHRKIIARGRCAPCYYRPKSHCRRCDRPGVIRETGVCGWCARTLAKWNTKPARPCDVCGEFTRHFARGMCKRCYNHDPDLPFDYAERLAFRLGSPPPWLRDFTAYAAARYCPYGALVLLRELGRLLSADARTPAVLLERARRPGRSVGALALTLEGFFVDRGMALALDQSERLARGRRRRLIQGTPECFRDAVSAFGDAELEGQRRARRAGTKPLSDITVERHLAEVRDFARFLERRSPVIDSWRLVSREEVEAFLATNSKAMFRRLSCLRRFFRWARARHLVLVDPTAGLRLVEPKGFRGKVLTHEVQISLYERWSRDAAAHPHEAFVGLMALLHGASRAELANLRVDAVEGSTRTVRLGQRPHPVPIDPSTWDALERCLAYREERGALNPHVLVTIRSATRKTAVSPGYLSHVLDAVGVSLQTLRSTRLCRMVVTLDPKVASQAFGMDDASTVRYLGDAVDRSRLDALNEATRN
ncbi:MAG: site-specific integrase [Actinomycetota bacterium]